MQLARGAVVHIAIYGTHTFALELKPAPDASLGGVFL
jgi:hypothetical protein